MRAGKLRHRVTIQSPTSATATRDALGERITDWTTVASSVPAAVEPMAGREAFLAAQRQSTATHTVRLRYESTWSAMDASWRILFGSRVLVLDGPPRNPDERNAELILTCIEGDRLE